MQRTCGGIEDRSWPGRLVLRDCRACDLAGADAASAAVVTVCSTGRRDQTTVQPGVNTAQPATRIQVCAGNFTEQVVVSKS